MSDVLLPKLPGRVRGRPFEKGRSGNPSGRRPGSRNKATLAAAALLAGEAEALTRTAVELALAGDPTAMRLCIERLLPPCRERSVKFTLPPIESVSDISAAMQAVTSALAKGDITPGEAATIAGVVETFARAIETTKRRAFAVDPLLISALSDCDETEDYDEADETDEYIETEGCDS
jgi:Family of unknown function (DUF5681)